MDASKGFPVLAGFADDAAAVSRHMLDTAKRLHLRGAFLELRTALQRFLHLSFVTQNLLRVSGDIAVSVLSLSLVFVFLGRLGGDLQGFIPVLLLFVAVKTAILTVYGIYRRGSRPEDIGAWGDLFNALLLSEFLLMIICTPSLRSVFPVLHYYYPHELPPALFPADGLLSLLMMGALRSALRVRPEASLPGEAGAGRKLTLIQGARTEEQKRIYLSPPHINGEVKTFITDAFESNWIAPLGPHVDAFEREFCEKVGLPHAVALNSGTAALHLALRALGVGAGDEVIAPSLTFIGGVSPVLFQGARLSFIDSDRISWNMDARLLREELEERGRRNHLPKAVICTDIYGQCADYDAVREVCDSWEVPVVIDAAESLGASYKGRHAGDGGNVAIYSFNGNKIITTSGGGMMASDDGALIERARFWSQQAREPVAYYEHTQVGYNYRMSNLLAAIGRGQLRVLDDRVSRKRSICDYYERELAGLPGIEFMPEAAYGRANRWLTVILIDPERFGMDREDVRLALEKQNIESRPVWKPMHLQPVFKGVPMRGGAVCEDFFCRGLCLPSGTAMTEEELSRVTGAIKDLSGRFTHYPENR